MRNIRTSLVLLRLGVVGPVLRSTITVPLPEHSISGRPLKAVAQLGELPIMLNMEERVMVTMSGLTVEGEKYKYLWAKFTSCVFFLWRKPHIWQHVLPCAYSLYCVLLVAIQFVFMFGQTIKWLMCPWYSVNTDY